MMKKSIRIGPFGGQGRFPWDDGVHTGVRQMTIRSGIVVDAIQIEYDDNGSFKWFEAHGHTTGGSSYLIKFDYPNEHLNSISGHYGTYSGRIYISSMIIKSNKRTFGPFGTKPGKYFFIPSTAGKIVGFFGKCGPYLASLGAYLEPPYPYKSIGPFGGNDGVSWDDGVFNAIRRIIIVSESVINSILIEYENDGSLVSSERHGGSGGGDIRVVELDDPDEYVTSISGYYGANSCPIVIQSLVIRTNRRVHGPFGVEKGKYFCFPHTDQGKIIGFHGKCGSHLYSIGGHLEITPNFYTVKTIGPFGSSNGYPWDDGFHSGIKQITITHGAFVGSISTAYYNNEDKTLVTSAKHGGDYESKTDTVKLDFPDEFLTSVSGYHSVLEMNDSEMTSITFQSNRRTYGPFGRIFGEYFSFPSFDGKILGFHGRSTRGCLYSIGAHVEPISHPKPSEFTEPFGVQSGDQWDDGIYTTIRQVVVSCGSLINSICVEYDKNGHSVWSSKHGRSIGEKTYTMKLDYPDEFLISFSGSYNENSSSTGIQSLKFQSNKKRYGPFGTGKGNKEFSLSSISGKIIGFHGKCGDYLNSIGAYLKPIPMSYKYKSIEARGWKGPNKWDDGIYTTIRELIIGSGLVVDSIQIEYDKHGRSLWSARHGESTGGSKYMVKLDFPSEYVVSISGYYGSDDKSPFIQSLTIKSNKTTYGPFGPTKGVPFSISSSGGKIIGFHGTTYRYLCSIGVYTETISPVTGQFDEEGDEV